MFPNSTKELTRNFVTMRDSKGLQVLWQREYNQRSFKVKRDGVKGEGKNHRSERGLSLPLLEVIINAEAFKDTKDKELKEFLEYLKTGKTKSEFTRRIEEMIQTVKQNEQARQEYRLMSTFEMDIKDRVKRETAKLMKNRGYPISEILLMTGLPEEEIEKL